MKLPALVLPLVLLISLEVGADQADSPPAGLKEVVTGLKTSREILAMDLLPVSYLEQLQVPNVEVVLNGPQRYALARQLLDVYHLGQALYHQSHFLPTQTPIIQLAEFNFPKMKQYRTESGPSGGYLTSRFQDFFESDDVDWSTASSYPKTQK